MVSRHRIHEIKGGRNLEQNIPILFNEIVSVNYVYAYTSCAMQYYGYYEAAVDGDIQLNEELNSLLKDISQIFGENFSECSDGENRERCIAQIVQIRERIIAKMRVLVTYSDILQLYEYVSNRIEGRFAGEMADIDDDTAAREILQYIFMDKDNSLINMKIKMVLGQLPVRMSRGKFCDLVEAGLMAYKGEDLSAAEDFIYRVESAAGLYRPKEFEGNFPELDGYYQELAAADWENLDAAAYENAAKTLALAIDKINHLQDGYYGIMEIVNNLYVCLLNFPYVSDDALKITDQVSGIVRQISSNIKAGLWENISEELVQEFEKTEGWMEKYGNEMLEYQGMAGEIQEHSGKIVEALMLDKLCRCLKLNDLLMSGSLFMDLESQADGTKYAEAELLSQKAEVLCTRLKEAFKGQSRMMNRAMEAMVLEVLPVPFDSQKEVMDYVRTSLSGCRDLAEKNASLSLIKEMMEE